MTFTDAMIFLAGWTGSSVAAVGVWGYLNWRRKDRAEKAFQELDADIIADIKAYPFLRDTADELAAKAERLRKSHTASRQAEMSAKHARYYQVWCERRLKAAGYDIVLGEVA